MAQGRFQKKKKKVNLAPIFCVTALIVAVCFIGTALILDSRSAEQESTAATPAAPGNLRPAVTTPGSTNIPTLPPLPTTDPTVSTTVPETVPETVPKETVPEETVPEETVTLGQKVAELAKAQIGKPYQLGGTGPDGFDTSGLVYYCLQENGISVSRVIGGQVAGGTPVEKEDLLPGDVVFFWTNEDAEVKEAEYVGIYVGDGKFVAARNPENPAKEFDLTGNYFSTRYVCARRYG